MRILPLPIGICWSSSELLLFSVSSLELLVVSKAFNGCLVLVRTLNLELLDVLVGAVEVVLKLVAVLDKDCLVGVVFEIAKLLSVEESMEAVVEDDEVDGLVLLIGCLCLTLNLDDALVDGITASVELSEVLVVEEVSLICCWSPPPALVFCKLTTRPRCLILSLLLIKLLLVEAKDESVDVLGMMDAGLGLNLCPSRSVALELARDLDLGLDDDEIEGLKGCRVCNVVSGEIVIVSTTAKFKKSFTLEAG